MTTRAQYGGAARSRVVGRRLVTLPRGRDRENRGSGRRWVTRRKSPSSIKLEGTAPCGIKTAPLAAETRQAFARDLDTKPGRFLAAVQLVHVVVDAAIEEAS